MRCYWRWVLLAVSFNQTVKRSLKYVCPKTWLHWSSSKRDWLFWERHTQCCQGSLVLDLIRILISVLIIKCAFDVPCKWLKSFCVIQQWRFFSLQMLSLFEIVVFHELYADTMILAQLHIVHEELLSSTNHAKWWEIVSTQSLNSCFSPTFALMQANNYNLNGALLNLGFTLSLLWRILSNVS